MVEVSLEELIQEQKFAGILQTQASLFFRLSNTLLARTDKAWNARHYVQLINEADSLESFLDDYGARYNRTYAFLTELVASLRWFAHSGYSISHVLGRLDSYGAELWGTAEAKAEGREQVEQALAFLRASALKLLESIREEAGGLGVEITPEGFPENALPPLTARRKLPRNVGEEEPRNEEQKIAEVATKFLQAAEMVAETGLRPIDDPEERHQFFSRICTEELARVYEATVHNLQSTYDTHIQNTVLEGQDERLPRLRGHVSAALHLLEAVTHLAHFIERHENEVRSEEAKRRIAEIVDRSEVERVTMNAFLYWAHRSLQGGVAMAEDLLPEYTNIQELEVELAEGTALHARPAALVVGIVNHHGTPVEMEVGKQTCNAGSILELLVMVGSQSNPRRFVFRGDERPLRDIGILFQHGLGEKGLDGLPESLDYLKQQ